MTHSRHQKLKSKLLKSITKLRKFFRSWFENKDTKSLIQNFSLLQQRAAKVGGARRDRTADLLRARQALSQLSYGPDLVGLGRFELPTSPLSGVRSNQLSYRPKVSRCLNIVELRSRYVADFR